MVDFLLKEHLVSKLFLGCQKFAEIPSSYVRCHVIRWQAYLEISSCKTSQLHYQPKRDGFNFFRVLSAFTILQFELQLNILKNQFNILDHKPYPCRLPRNHFQLILIWAESTFLNPQEQFYSICKVYLLPNKEGHLFLVFAMGSFTMSQSQLYRTVLQIECVPPIIWRKTSTNFFLYIIILILVCVHHCVYSTVYKMQTNYVIKELYKSETN